MNGCGLIFAILLAVSTAMASDLDSLLDRLREDYSSNVPPEESLKIVEDLHSDGTWSGPKYHEKGHTPIEHLKKTRTLAESYAYACAGPTANSECLKIKESAIRSLLFWFNREEDFVNDNWWMNEVGVPRVLAPIALLLWDELPDSLRTKIIRCFPELPSRNGVNRTWISELVVIRGILERRDSLIYDGLKNIESTMLVTSREGHQKDHSFFMHGNLLYNGGYGKMALSIGAKWASFCRGTVYAFNQETLDAMSALALHGNRWMMWKGMVDPMVLGREISRKDDNKNAGGYVYIIRNLESVDSSRAEDYSLWKKEIKGENFLSGCHYFERGELMVCRSDDYYISLKMSSRKTVGSESINRENRKGFWLGAGVLSVYRHPDDFKDIYPLWDWSMLPGITCYDKSEQKEKRVTNESRFVGGLSEGNIGVATMIVDRSGIYAKKTWVFINGTVVALGADISSRIDSPIRTTLDQRLLSTDFSLESVPAVGDSLESLMVLHNGIGYRSLDGQTFKVKVENREGNWSEIGTTKFVEHGKIFSLWIDHGILPQKAKYAYLMEVGAKIGHLTSGHKERILVLQNDPVGQIIYDAANHIVCGTMFRAASFKFNQQAFFFDVPCVFIFREDGGFLKDLLKKDLVFEK